MAPEPWGETVWYRCATWGRVTRILCTLVDSALTVVHCTKVLLWWGLRAVLTCGYKEMSLEGSLIICSLSKIIVVSPLLIIVLLFSPAWVLGQIYSSKHVFPSMDQALSQLKSDWLPPPNIYTAIAPTGVYHQISQYCSTWISQLGKNVDSAPTQRLYSTLWHYEIYLELRKLLGQYQLDASIAHDKRMCCFYQ